MTMELLLIAPLLFVVAWLLVRELRNANVRTRVAESFALQHAELDGHSIPAGTLEVIRRWSPSGGVDLYGRQGLDSATFTVNWLCRSADRSYLRAIAQGGRGPDGKINIAWVWRRLTEERARHSLIGNRRVYRATFGDDPSAISAAASALARSVVLAPRRSRRSSRRAKRGRHRHRVRRA